MEADIRKVWTELEVNLDLRVPPDPQITGALGAAILARRDLVT